MNKQNIKTLVSQIKKVKKGLKSSGDYVVEHEGSIALTYKGYYGMVFDKDLLEGTEVEIEDNSEIYSMLIDKFNPIVDTIDVTENFNDMIKEKRVVADTVYEFNLNDIAIYYNKKYIDMLNKLAGKNKRVWIEKNANVTSRLIFISVSDEFWGIVLPIRYGAGYKGDE